MSFRYEIIDCKAWLKDLVTSEYQETSLPKLFHNDVLDNDNQIVSSEIRTVPYLVGIFSTSQTQRFGKNKRGNVIYMVKPLNNKLPGFMISYGGKLKGKLAVKFKYINWNNKLPSGEIIDVIGKFEEDNITKILMYHHNIYPKKLKTTENQFEESIERKDLTHLNIFSIDPEGCVDIDDALSITKEGDNVIVGVHIAQPICWLSYQDIRTKMKYQFSTLYIDENNRKDLWDSQITEKASLFQDQKKPAYSVLFYFENNTLIKTEDFPSFIINKSKLTYENAKECPSAVTLETFTENFTSIDDYHDTVSYWMVKTNNHIGVKLKNKIPYRVNHQDDNLEVEIEGLPKDIGKIFTSKKIESAYYSMEEIRHQTLGLNYYCHFTSPIRRLIDTWIHFYLTYPSIRDEMDIDCQSINKLDKETKKFHRQLELDKIIKNMFFEKSNVEMTGYISEILSYNSIEVYVDGVGFLKVRLFNFKFDYLVTKSISGNSLSLNYQDQSYNYKIGDSIELFFDKIDGILPRDKMMVRAKNSISFI